jgi:hypothetical protein
MSLQNTNRMRCNANPIVTDDDVICEDQLSTAQMKHSAAQSGFPPHYTPKTRFQSQCSLSPQTQQYVV